jgi:hypothetical protein
MKSVGAQIKQLHGIIEELSDWEQSFVESVWTRSDEGRKTLNLTERQVDIVPTIYRKHFGD